MSASAVEIPFDLYGDLIGVPFVRGGRDTSTGLDCYGLVIEMNRRLGVDIPDFASPGSLEAVEELIGRNKGRWRKVDPCPGATLLFRVEGYLAHVGIMLSPVKMLHCQDPIGVMTAAPHFWPRLVSAYVYE